MSKWLKRAKKANPLLEDLSNILFRKRSKDKEALKDFSGWPWANDEKEVQYDHKKLNEWNASPLEEVALVFDLIEKRSQHERQALVDKIVTFCKEPYATNIGATIKPDPSNSKAASRPSSASAGTTRSETEREQLKRLRTEREKLDRRIAKLEEKLGPSASGSNKRKATHSLTEQEAQPKKRKTAAAKRAERSAQERAYANGDVGSKGKSKASSKKPSGGRAKSNKRSK